MRSVAAAVKHFRGGRTGVGNSGSEPELGRHNSGSDPEFGSVLGSPCGKLHLLVEPNREVDTHIWDPRDERSAGRDLHASGRVLDGDGINTNPGTVFVPPERILDVALLHRRPWLTIGAAHKDYNLRRTIR